MCFTQKQKLFIFLVHVFEHVTEALKIKHLFFTHDLPQYYSSITGLNKIDHENLQLKLSLLCGVQPISKRPHKSSLISEPAMFEPSRRRA